MGRGTVIIHKTSSNETAHQKLQGSLFEVVMVHVLLNFSNQQTPIQIFSKSYCDINRGIYSVQCFYDPQLQTKCCYIARYYVKIMHMRLGVIKHIFPLNWGAETEFIQIEHAAIFNSNLYPKGKFNLSL